MKEEALRKMAVQNKRELEISELLRELILIQIFLQELETKITLSEIDYYLHNLPNKNEIISMLIPVHKRQNLTSDKLPTLSRLFEYLQINYFNQNNIMDVIQGIVDLEMKPQKSQQERNDVERRLFHERLQEMVIIFRQSQCFYETLLTMKIMIGAESMQVLYSD